MFLACNTANRPHTMSVQRVIHFNSLIRRNEQKPENQLRLYWGINTFHPLRTHSWIGTSHHKWTPHSTRGPCQALSCHPWPVFLYPSRCICGFAIWESWARTVRQAREWKYLLKEYWVSRGLAGVFLFGSAFWKCSWSRGRGSIERQICGVKFFCRSFGKFQDALRANDEENFALCNSEGRWILGLLL